MNMTIAWPTNASGVDWDRAAHQGRPSGSAPGGSGPGVRLLHSSWPKIWQTASQLQPPSVHLIVGAAALTTGGTGFRLANCQLPDAPAGATGRQLYEAGAG